MYVKIRAKCKLVRAATNDELKQKLAMLCQVYADYANGHLCIGDNSVKISKLAHAFADDGPRSDNVSDLLQRPACLATPLASPRDLTPFVIVSDSEDECMNSRPKLFPVCEIDNSNRPKRTHDEYDTSSLSLDNTFVDSSEHAWTLGSSADWDELPETTLEAIKHSAQKYSADPQTSEALLIAVKALVDSQNKFLKLKKREIEINLRFVELKEQQEAHRQARRCAKLVVRASKGVKSTRKKHKFA
ncbi:hypothetical protein IW148_001594 [Coemansia sp. RSA 1199]|nr:hypothetical protein IW148_001594 [Coemansia sp. RSA 1199]